MSDLEVFAFVCIQETSEVSGSELSSWVTDPDYETQDLSSWVTDPD